MRHIVRLASLAFVAVCTFAQTNTRFDGTATSPPQVSTSIPVPEPAKRYEGFLASALSLELFSADDWATRTALHFKEAESRSLLQIANDLSDKSDSIDKNYRKWKFESLMESIELGKPSPAVDKIMRDITDQRTRAILDAVQRLKAALGEERFREVDAYVQSGMPMLSPPTSPMPRAAPAIKLK